MTNDPSLEVPINFQASLVKMLWVWSQGLVIILDKDRVPLSGHVHMGHSMGAGAGCRGGGGGGLLGCHAYVQLLTVGECCKGYPPLEYRFQT